MLVRLTNIFSQLQILKRLETFFKIKKITFCFKEFLPCFHSAWATQGGDDKFNFITCNISKNKSCDSLNKTIKQNRLSMMLLAKTICYAFYDKKWLQQHICSQIEHKSLESNNHLFAKKNSNTQCILVRRRCEEETEKASTEMSRTKNFERT